MFHLSMELLKEVEHRTVDFQSLGRVWEEGVMERRWLRGSEVQLDRKNNFFCCSFETGLTGSLGWPGTHYVAQACLEVVILLSQPLWC
jgi:hypothetical protein